MDKATRNAIERATQQARKLLEDDFSSQLEGTFDVMRSGVIASQGGSHLSSRQVLERNKILGAIEHKRTIVPTTVDAVADYIRDAAFTTLNRFVALKMLEARELVRACISKKELSAGYLEFCGMAPGLARLPESAGYRVYIESVFDELSTEVKILFDRRDAASVLWPKRQTLDALLDILNATDLSGVWGEDETIGWVYQFFNSAEERKAMREESPAPRNSHELAVRNQFFTPRYVVQFLTDNTLGRLWLEMHGESTRINAVCEYIIPSIGEEPGRRRPLKDPRDLRILDPACGSGHFLLYSFDLLLTIYEEAWFAATTPNSHVTGRSLRDDYVAIEDLRLAAPRLIIEHNLCGVDIDPRCAQIAALALWLRAQRAWNDLGVAACERPVVQRTRIVVAEPMPGDAALVNEFAAQLNPPLLRDLFKKMVEESRLAGELGTLLRIEDSIAVELSRAREQFVKQPQMTAFLPGLEPPRTYGSLDLSGIDDDSFFYEAEIRIVDSLRVFAETASSEVSVRRRLFAGDAAQGVALIDLMRTRFDIVLMNPPFGEASVKSAQIIENSFPDWNKNVLCAFVARANELLHADGLCGSVVDRTVNEKSTYEEFRLRFLLNDDFSILNVADLGWGVLDANVEVSALVISRPTSDLLWGLDARGAEHKDEVLRSRAAGRWVDRKSLRRLPNSVIGYFFPEVAIRLFATYPSLLDASFDFFEGHTLKAARYFRLAWECSADSAGSRWQRLFNGTSYSRFAYPHHDVAVFGEGECARADESAVLRNVPKHQKSGVCFGKRGEYVDAQMLPPGFLSTVEGKVCLAPTTEDAWALLALLNSRLFQAMINLYTGQHKYSGYVEQCPYPGAAKLAEAAELARAIVEEKWSVFARVEISPNFEGLEGLTPASLVEELRAATNRVERLEKELNRAVLDAYGCSTDDSAEAFIENACKREPDTRFPFRTDDLASSAAHLLQYQIGKAFNRWHHLDHTAAWPVEALTFGNWGDLVVGGDARRDGPGILVLDEGHPADLARLLEDASPGAELASILNALEQSLRPHLQFTAFSDHLSYYSASGRRAPVYWQLSTPSSSYSVWIYYHRVTSDTFYNVQTSFVAPKVAHEERRLEVLRSEVGPNPDAAERKRLTVQECLVDELRAFLNDVKLIAPLWNPDLDDGAIINFAPLWRLVPQHKPWQKELKATWDGLCSGAFDWAHLAMRLWPERVIPKCAADRSLAVAHGLETVFWTDGGTGKWKARSSPTRTIDALVRERTSAAVKAALESLLDAPVAAANGGRARGRRSATAPSGRRAG
jgi:hypothetical protein